MSDEPNILPPPLQPTTSLVNDPVAPGTTGWDGMPAAARVAACLLALGASWPLDTTGMRYDARTRIAYASRPSPWATPKEPDRRQVIQILVDGDEAKFIDRIRAGHGTARAQEVERLAHPKKRWFPGRKSAP